MSFTRRPTDGSAIVSVDVRKGVEGYFERLGWEREEVGRRGLPWGELFGVGVGFGEGRLTGVDGLGHSEEVKLSKWINAHQL